MNCRSLSISRRGGIKKKPLDKNSLEYVSSSVKRYLIRNPLFVVRAFVKKWKLTLAPWKTLPFGRPSDPSPQIMRDSVTEEMFRRSLLHRWSSITNKTSQNNFFERGMGAGNCLSCAGN